MQRRHGEAHRRRRRCGRGPGPHRPRQPLPAPGRQAPLRGGRAQALQRALGRQRPLLRLPHAELLRGALHARGAAGRPGGEGLGRPGLGAGGVPGPGGGRRPPGAAPAGRRAGALPPGAGLLPRHAVLRELHEGQHRPHRPPGLAPRPGGLLRRALPGHGRPRVAAHHHRRGQLPHPSDSEDGGHGRAGRAGLLAPGLCPRGAQSQNMLQEPQVSAVWPHLLAPLFQAQGERLDCRGLPRIPD
mmetsp:Transcript_59036/g.172842  ORF Transcript_59036/g.172842 Transcript_59036/m.172842 type:complete len:243 (+) Transcript_59036:791-1519(+)